MSWLITFGIFSLICIFVCLFQVLIEGACELAIDTDGLTWKAYVAIIFGICVFIFFISCLHHIVVNTIGIV